VTALARLLADVPVQPDADEARRWAQDELTDPIYHHTPSLLERLLDWLGGLFDDMPRVGLDTRWLAVGVLLVAVVVALLAFYVAGPVRRSRRVRSGPAPLVNPGDDRTAAQLRADADAAAGRGDWRSAVMDRFRAVVRSLEERVVLDVRPGRTADEAAAVAGVRFPAEAEALRRGARLFDDVCYGDVPAGPEDDQRLRDLDRRLRDLRPGRDAGAAPTGAEPTGAEPVGVAP